MYIYSVNVCASMHTYMYNTNSDIKRKTYADSICTYAIGKYIAIYRHIHG